MKRRVLTLNFLAVLVVMGTVVAIPSNSVAAACKNYFGHYLKGNLSDIRNAPGYEGIRREHTWRELEPRKGVYNIGIIKRELDAAKAAGKKVIVLIETTQYGNTPALPAYLLMNQYGGGSYNANWSKQQQAQKIAMLYRKDISDRYIALIKALGRSLDTHPALALIESSEILIYPPPAPGLSQTQLRANFKQWVDAYTGSFRQTPTAMMMNFGMAPYKFELAAYVNNKSMGFGNPDMTRAPYEGCRPVDQTDTYGFVFSRYRTTSHFSVMASMAVSRCLASPKAAFDLANRLGGDFMTWVKVPAKWTRQQQDAFVNSKARSSNGGFTNPKPAKLCSGG